MSLDYTATAQLLDNVLFEEKNATANIQTADLVALAQILDQSLPSGTTDPTPYIAPIMQMLTGDLATLSPAQVTAAANWFLPYRDPPPNPPAASQNVS